MTSAPLREAFTAAATRIAPARALPAGARLRDYEIRGVVGDSGIGIVYTAWDHSLQRKVAIREYLPAALAARADGSPAVVVRPSAAADAFRAGLHGFIDEARQLARFDHPSLLKVYRFWEDNGTAYRVMPFHDGPTLSTALAALGRVPGEAELRAWLKPVLDAVAALHAGRTWHRHIGPDEIVLTPTGPILLGFAADARALAAADGSPAAALAAGYAAPEQYGADADASCGPWTDLYALAAVVYGAIAGAPPDVATDRLTGDALQPLSQVAAGLYDAGFLAAIDASLALDPAARPQDHAAFRRLMGGIDAAEPVSLAPPRDLMQEPFLGGVDADREVTVPDRPLLASATASASAPASPPAPASMATAAASPAPAAAPSRPRAAAPPARATAPMPHDGAAAATKQAQRAGGGSNAGKRMLYGIVAATCVGIGIAALALQFYLRPPARAGAVTSPATPAAAAAPATTTTTTPSTAAPGSVTAPADAASRGASPAAAATGSAAERQSRCIDILQKASLEAISAADTEFFKKECK